MDKQLVNVIERAVQSDKMLFPFNGSWQRLHREYNIGDPLGNKIRLSDRDKADLIALVRQCTGRDVRESAGEDFANLTRGETLLLAKNEKWAGRKVSANRLAVKAMPGQRLSLNARTLALPARSHLDMAVEAVASIEHAAFLVIENYESFDRLEQMHLVLSEPFRDALVVYRGDPHSGSAKAVKALLQSQAKPVAALVDLDPAGLLIAQALPHIAGIVAPADNVLQRLLEQGNPALYHKQRAGAENALQCSPHAAIRRLWALMERFQTGLVQEHWLRGDVELLIHALDP